jgi:hypothetical protein
MRIFLLLSCFIFCSFSLVGQSPRTESVISFYLKGPLQEIKAMAGDSAGHYRKLFAAAAAKGKTLMGNDKLAKNAFGHGVLAIYTRLYGADTARLVSVEVEKWHTCRQRIYGWAYVYGRAKELESKNGRKELYTRYGTKLEEILKNDKKRKELIKRELIRGVVFFHKWMEPLGPSGSSTYKSIAKIVKDTKTFKPRKTPPSSLASVTAGGAIPAEDIMFSYPQNQQANFYPLEYKRAYGQIYLRNYPSSSLREASEAGKLWVRWKSTKGKILYTRAAVTGSAISYLPPTYFLNPREVYELAVVKSSTDAFNKVIDFYSSKALSELISKRVYHREKKETAPEEVYFKAYFRVSEYGSFFSKTLGHDFTRVDAVGTACEVEMAEPLGPEEVVGLHGFGPQARFSNYGCRAAEDVLDKLYGSTAKAFFSHPRQEYVDYLKRNRGTLNIDSLVAIEFLPVKERSGKYRRLKYEDNEGKRLSAFSRGLPLPGKPVQRNCIYLTGDAQPITEAIFRNPAEYDGRPSTFIVRDTFAEAVQRIALEMAPLLEARKEEYADILRQLNELSPQALAGKDLSQVVDDINSWYLTDPRHEKMIGLKTCFPEKMSAGYGLPLGVMHTTAGRMKVELEKN